MGRMFDKMVQFFEEAGVNFSILEENALLEMGVSGKNGTWSCVAQAREEEDQFIFHSILPIKVPPKNRVLVAEFIARVNYGMVIGAFELDFSDGDVGFKTGICLNGEDLNRSLIEPIVAINLRMVDYFLPPFMQVLYGKVSPEEAVLNAIEGSLVDEVESQIASYEGPEGQKPLA